MRIPKEGDRYLYRYVLLTKYRELDPETEINQGIKTADTAGDSET